MQTVYVAMSGGVDSSVAAALLKKQGYNVTGVYMKNWTADILGFQCPWREDLTDAQSVAAKLQIPFKIFDFQKQYKQKVVDYMVAEFRAGRTPNPDIVCNQEIKFKLFLDTALDDGADLIATGHYAQIRPFQGQALGTALGSQKSGKKGRKKQWGLVMAKDKAKDQSYFLYRLEERALAKTLMPIGGYTKPQIRKLAKEFGLPTADKPDSMGICFVGQVDIKDFLRQFIKIKPGPVILQKTGKQIGEHEGAIFYTIGQRHGLGIGGGKPLYVISKNVKKNQLFVSDDPGELELYGKKILIKDAHWINEAPNLRKTYQIRVRHTGKLNPGRVVKVRGGFEIRLDKPERAITSGQSAVIYDNALVIGGGVISTPVKPLLK